MTAIEKIIALRELGATHIELDGAGDVTLVQFPPRFVDLPQRVRQPGEGEGPPPGQPMPKGRRRGMHSKDLRAGWRKRHGHDGPPELGEAS